MGVLSTAQDGLRRSSASMGLLIFRVLSALVFGYTITLIGQGLLFYGAFAYWFVLTVGFLLIMRVTRSWSYVGVFLLNLIFFLIGMLLRMYVLVAPGA